METITPVLAGGSLLSSIRMNWVYWRPSEVPKPFSSPALSPDTIQLLNIPMPKRAESFSSIPWVITKLLWSFFPPISTSEAPWVRRRSTERGDHGPGCGAQQCHGFPQVPEPRMSQVPTWGNLLCLTEIIWGWTESIDPRKHLECRVGSIKFQSKWLSD